MDLLFVLLSSTLSPWRRITLQFFSVLYICYVVVWEQGSCSLVLSLAACLCSLLAVGKTAVLGKTLWLILFISATTHCCETVRLFE